MIQARVKPTFRKACKDDLPAIVALLADDGLGRGREDASLPLNEAYTSAFDVLDKDPNQYLLVADDDGVVAGCMQLTFIPGISRSGAWRCQIEAVRVGGSYRGHGLGQQMFEWAIVQAKSRNCALLQLTTDKARNDAHRFYDRLGFQPSHVGYKMQL